MAVTSGEQIPPTSEERDRAVAALCRHFAADTLDTEELERRLDVAYRTRSRVELERLLADLPALPVPAEGSAGPAAPRVDESLAVGEREVLVGILGGAERKGVWTPARKLQVLAVMGGVELDFREARWSSPVTEVTVFAVMGGVEILVPPGLRVEVEGTAILGAFGHAAAAAEPAPDAPRLRVRGVALMGEVEVEVRHPGESGREARRRLKAERRKKRKLPPGSA